MSFEGVFRLDGKVVGEILNSGTLILGETAIVKGTLGVNALILNGRVEGEVNARERVEIHSKGKVYEPLWLRFLLSRMAGSLREIVKWFQNRMMKVI